jgi:VanZ family protein
LIRRFSLEFFILGLLLILSLTLSPFNFSVQDNFALWMVKSRFRESGNPENLSIGELLANIFLFLPLGFGCAGLVAKKARSTVNIWLMTVMVSGSLSLIIEGLQVFLISRTPAVTDLVTNTVGGFLGGLIYLSSSQIDDYCTRVVRRLEPLFSWRSFLIGLVVYIAFLFCSGFFLQRLTSLKSWSPAFPLILGNEQTGNRPWEGYISQLSIADRSLSNKEAEQILTASASFKSLKVPLVAAYQFVGDGAYSDQAHQLSPLIWRGKQPPIHKADLEKEKGVRLGRGRWLETTAPATPLTRRLQRTSQFTIDTIITPTKLFQSGPARILSLSRGPYQRNLTLGQDGNALILRMRTGLTGQNGTEPELRIPTFFTDLQPKHLLITYDGLMVQFYGAPMQPPYFLELNLGISISRFLLIQSPEWSASLRDENHKLLYKALYHGIIFIPLGFAWAFISFRDNQRNLRYVYIFAFLLLVILIESVFSGGRGRRAENQIYALSMTIFSACIAKVWLQYRFRRDSTSC